MCLVVLLYYLDPSVIDGDTLHSVGIGTRVDQGSVLVTREIALQEWVAVAAPNDVYKITEDADEDGDRGKNGHEVRPN